MASTSSSTPEQADRSQRTPRKAAVAAWSGSALEYYDLAIYGTAAALVFPKIFFPEGHAATIASLATFGVAYVARPFGSFLMGHIGDRLGRKTVLIGTLLLMGVSTFLIGVLPTYSQVGLLAPALLVTLRLLQGLSAAGEQAGANSMSFEHAPDRRRGFFTSFTLSGTQAGQVLAPAVFLPVAAVMPEEQLLSWGWRVPFWLSAVLLVVGFLIRRSLEETPEFTAQTAEKASRPARTPLAELFRDHRSGVLRVFFAAFIAMVNTAFQVFALNFATSDDYGIGIDRDAMLWLAIVSNLVAIATIPAWATLSDRIGRKQVFVTGALGSGVLTAAFLWAISTGNVTLVFVLGIALAGVVYSMPNAVWPATYAEYFPTSVRLSGMAVGTQFGFALAGFTPSIAGALVGGSPDGWWKVALFAFGACLVSSVAVLTGPRATHLVPTAEVGLPRSAAPARARTTASAA